eukprot:scaffold2430_cov336-Prasinococcus_capsulatus_cf.AAC.3
MTEAAPAANRDSIPRREESAEHTVIWREPIFAGAAALRDLALLAAEVAATDERAIVFALIAAIFAV